MIAPWAREYLTRRITYADRGRDFARGRLDCFGLVVLVNREQLGRELPDFAYPSSSDHAAAEGAVVEARPAFEQVDLADALPGDVVLIRLGGAPLHAAVHVGGDHVLQLRRPGVSLDSIAPGRPLSRRVEGVYRPCA